MEIKKIGLVSVLAYLLGMFFYGLDQLLQSFPSVLTNEFMQYYQTDSLGVAFIASSYFYLYNIFQLPSGYAIDRFGTKRIMSLSCLICVFSLFFLFFSKTLSQAIASRIFMGLGASSAATLSVVISIEYFETRWIPFLMGAGQLLGNLGPILGQYPFHVLNQCVGWKHSFLILALIPFLFCLLALCLLKTKTKSHVAMKNSFGAWRSIFLNTMNWHIALYAMLVWTPFYIFSSLWGIPFLVARDGMTTAHASEVMMMAWMGSGVGSILLGSWSSLIQQKKMGMILCSLLGLLVFPLLIWAPIRSEMMLCVLIFVFGMASSGMALSFALIHDHNAQEQMGLASAFNNTVIMAGSMLADPVIGYFIRLHALGQMHHGIPMYHAGDYLYAFNFMWLLMAIGFLFALAYPSGSRSHAKVLA